ncbi:MAG: hypothetical protein KF678_09475 [Phycisphaeraceae bacterium]|nr:hypothetical protein [Phycisphaeraceae bacterium]
MGHIPPASTLLCESCGYEIAGLPASAPCPECARPARDSHPDRRTGSPWQQHPSLRAWVLTNFLMLRHPRRTFDLIQMDSRGRFSLLLINLLLAGLLCTLPWIGTLIGDPARNARDAAPLLRYALFFRSTALGTIAITFILFGLTAIEAYGIMFFGRRRAWRITPDIAWQVCAHASIGWILAALFTLLSLAIYLNLSSFGLSRWFDSLSRTSAFILASVPLAGFFAGMLIFETLVYTGMRRCRFANAPITASPVPTSTPVPTAQ